MGNAALSLREVGDRRYRAVPSWAAGAEPGNLIRFVHSGASPQAMPAHNGGPAEPAASNGPGRISTAWEAVQHGGLAEAVATADPDAIEDLGDEIAMLSAHIDAATHRLLVLIAEFDRLRGWEPAGHRSCAHWLAVRTSIDLGTAARRYAPRGR